MLGGSHWVTWFLCSSGSSSHLWLLLFPSCYYFFPSYFYYCFSIIILLSLLLLLFFLLLLLFSLLLLLFSHCSYSFPVAVTLLTWCCSFPLNEVIKLSIILSLKLILIINFLIIRLWKPNGENQCCIYENRPIWEPGEFEKNKNLITWLALTSSKKLYIK